MSYIRNNKILLLIIGVLLVTNIAVLYLHTWKRHYPAYGKSMREEVMRKLEKEVGFNIEQLARYDSLRTKHFDSMKPLFEDLRTAKENFFNLLTRSDVTDSVINIYSAVMQEKQKTIDLKMFNYFMSVKEIATQEQKPKMDSFIVNITKRMTGPRPGADHKEDRKDKK